MRNNFKEIISKNTNQVQTKSLTNLSKKNLLKAFKPQKYNLPKDILPFDIYEKMYDYIKKDFPSIPKKIELKKSEIIIRKDLIIQMKNFINNYKLNPNSFYFSVYFMDKLLEKKINLNLEKIAIGSLLLSVKFNDIDGKIPRSSLFQKILISSEKISSKELNDIEIECLKNLDYFLSEPQPLYFLNIFLLNGIIFNNDFNLDSCDEKRKMFFCNIYQKTIEIYEEIIMISPDYFQYNPIYLSCACIALARESCNLKPWNLIFENIFHIYFEDFINELNFIKQKHKDINEELKKKKMIESEKEKKKDIEILKTSKEKIPKDKLTYNSYTSELEHKRLSTMVNNLNYNNILIKANQRYDSFNNYSYIYKPLSFDIHSEQQRSQIMKRKSNEIELNLSDNSTEASANYTARSDIYNNTNKLFYTYKKMSESNKKIKNIITFNNYYKMKLNSDNKLIEKKKFYNDDVNYNSVRLSQINDSRRNLFINKSKTNYVKMASTSYCKNNSSKKNNYLNESYSSKNYIPQTSSFNSEEKNYKKYGMNTISSFHIKDPYKTLKTSSNQNFIPFTSKRIIGNIEYNFKI